MEEYRYFLIRCKKCGNSMKYMTKSRTSDLKSKRKSCVYCGHSLNVSKSIVGPSTR